MDLGHRGMAVIGAAYPHVLVVAGSDSSGGAGLARDVETVAAFGLRAAIAVTAVTVQTHRAVRCVKPVPPDLVADQMRAALESNRIGAVKIGMLAGRKTIGAVASVLADHPHVPTVLDPVLAASSGGLLLEPEAIALLADELMPLCSLITPNRSELAILAGGEAAKDEEGAVRQAETLLARGCRAVLAKGGHSGGERSTDILVQRGRAPVLLNARRLAVEMRGTGCMLSSAIGAGLAMGRTLEDSVADAKAWLFRALQKTSEEEGGGEAACTSTGNFGSARADPA